jgi:ferric-dicitrate binding protein FerR (iron transport regulator)/Mg-chelatase subunit ChlD
MTGPTPTCADVLDALAQIVEGDEETIERFANHLASCDHCRDLRHDARLAAEAAAEAGAAYEHPNDFGDKLETALNGTEKPTSGTVDQEGIVDAASAPEQPVRDEPSAPSPVPESRRSKDHPVALYAMAAAALVLMVGGGIGLYVAGRAPEGAEGSESSLTGRPIDASEVPTIARIVRGARDGVAGLSWRPPGTTEFVAASVDTALQPGGTLRTDERTRVQLNLAGGSHLLLNHNTELTWEATTVRQYQYLLGDGGELMAEVQPTPDRQPLRFRTSSGQVEVLGTKLVVSANEAQTSVRVTRGLVRVQNKEGQRQEVKTGEEAILSAQGPITVASAANLASSLSWSELGIDGEPQTTSLSGLGELRARRPGERAEQERPLSLVRHHVRVRIMGNVARTEVEEVFRNDSAVTLEGIYRFPLPPDARIARLALDVEGRLEEGAFVERDVAAKIWRGVIRQATPQRQQQREEFIWVPGPWRDPALLEWQQGGQFQLRIFPIPARGERRVILAYEQTVTSTGGGRRYVYPLPQGGDDSTRVGNFVLDLRIAGLDTGHAVQVQGYRAASRLEGQQWQVTMSENSFLPAGDIVVDYRLPNENQELRWWTYQGPAVATPSAPRRGRANNPAVRAVQQTLAADGRPHVVFALRPELPARQESRQRDYVLLVDSSQSMVGERFARATQLVTRLVAEMDRRDRFLVMACDATCQSKPGGPRPPSVDAAQETRLWLSNIRPAGASNVGHALQRAAEIGRQSEREVNVLYIGDGVATAGHRRPAPLAARVRALREQQGLSFTTVGLGSDADAVLLAAIARAGGGHYLPYVPGQTVGTTALRVLQSTYGVALQEARLEFPAGITDVAPQSLPTLRAGEEVLVAARFQGPVQGEVVLRGQVGGQPYVDRYPVNVRPTTAAGNAFVPRLWASAMIDHLQTEGKGVEQNRIVALSRGYGVMSRFTSLLVLESAAMFRAFGIDRARPAIDWTGEEEMDSEQSTGLERHAGPTVTQSRASSRSGGGRAGMGSLATRGAAPMAEAEAMAPAPMAAAPRSAARRERRRPSRSRADLDDLGGESLTRRVEPPVRPPQPVPPPPNGAGRWMKRVWERVGSIAVAGDPTPRDHRAVQQAEQALQQAPHSRDRHRDLFRAVAHLGDLNRAETVASQWISRDQLDAEALIALADTWGRQGRRDEALRLLTGIVDVEPDNGALHRRLAEAYERAGQGDQACAHRIARAEVDGSEAAIVGAAVACERRLGHHVMADLLLAAIEDQALRRRVEQAATTPPRQRRHHGDLMINASWNGTQDLDISLINQRGTRISWMGGRRNVVSQQARVPGSEQLGLRWTPPGRYVIEVSRTDPHDPSPLTGQVTVQLLGERQRIPFTLTGPNTVVGRVRVRRESRLVPVR